LTPSKKNCPSAVTYPKNTVVFVPDVDAQGGGGDYLLTTEIFATGLGVKYVDSTGDLQSYFPLVTSVVNDKIFGSLSCSVMIDPSTRKTLGGTFDEFLYSLNWGSIGVNVWAGMMALNPYGTWGAPKNRHTDQNIQSGKGKMGNVLLFRNVNKSVIESPFCDTMMASLMSPPDTAFKGKALAYSNLAVNQSIGSLFNLLIAFNKSGTN